MKSEFVELIGKEHPLRVLFALRSRGPQRFSALEKTLDLNPTQLDRALTWLTERVYVLAATQPSSGARGPNVVAYTLSKRGGAFLEAFDAFLASAEERREVLGEKPVRELAALAA